MPNHFPTLDELRPNLQIQPINTGQVLNYRGIVSDNDEGLKAITNSQGKVEISSGIEMPSYMYRGQTEEFIPCLPSLGRIKRTPQILLSLCRTVAFEEAIGNHPFVKKTENTQFLNCFLNVDRKGLAQHYGLVTDLIDVTSNFDVATFFAVCRWDSQTQTYLPIQSASKPGVIYRISAVFLMNSAFLNEKKEEVFNFMGWQPLKRPEQQRACGIRLTKGQDFIKMPAVQMVRFRHNPEISERIWHSFDQGHALFPEDPAADLAKQALDLNCFTREQVDRAWIRLETWKGRTYSSKKRRCAEKQEKIRLLNKPILTWDGLNVESDEQKLQENLYHILEKVKFRRVWYPGEES
ncbi:MAG: FRG domain-containing protein [Candidatus Cloacimonetes bacterium]|nr:FRG domain-containing protein [Candidatus Cloacimonadota bacterium]MDY0230424.1 FRG domain-containing protein [Candidatus Cloacimonadaceae bacterium]